MFNAIRKPTIRTLLISIFVLISVLCLIFYFNYAHKQKMYEKFSSNLPEGFFNKDNPTHWEIAIKVRKQMVRDMESPKYKKREQEKMKRMGFEITPSDEIIRKRYLQIKKELNFAKKELERLTGGRKKH